MVKPGSALTTYYIPQLFGPPKEEPGAMCRVCMRAICLTCHAKGRCVPLERQIERMEARGRMLKAAGLLVLLAFSSTAYAQPVHAGGRLTGVGHTVTITVPTSAATYDAGTSSTLAVSGTSQSDRRLHTCTWTNDLGGSGAATTTAAAWSISSVALTVGTNVVTVTCVNNEGTSALDVITITRSSSSAVTCTHYFDPDVSAGTHVGTQANPFQTAAQMWTVVNTALASGDVTLCVSTREAGSDTNELWNAADLDVTQKTANPTGTLTINGRSYYNTNDTTPSWSAYSGSSRAKLRGIISQNSSHTKYSKVIIDGIILVQTGSDKGISICGDSWIIRNSNISYGPLNDTGSPLILIVPTAEGDVSGTDPLGGPVSHEGSGSWCPASSGITIEDSVIHDSNGELIYVGGAGCDAEFSTADKQALRTDNNACGGYPSHSDVTIQRNTLSGCGSVVGRQGDCIDVKAGLLRVTIKQNDISGNYPDNDTRCIVLQGTRDGTDAEIVIERNKIHDCLTVSDGAVAMANSWGLPNGYTFRNNLIYGTTSGAGLRVYSTGSLGVKVYGNTIYNNSDFAILTDSGATLVVQDNALLANNSSGAQNSFGTAPTATFNAYGGSWGSAGTCSSGCVSGLTAAAFTNAAGADFTLTVASVLLNVGTTIGTFSDDYLGTSRPQGVAWDIGAYER